MAEVKKIIQILPRAKIAKLSIKNYGTIIVCKSDKEIIDIVNQIAPEHLEIKVKNYNSIEKRIINAVGHFPVLKNLNQEKIDHFKNQIELISIKEEKQIEIIQQKINEIKLNTYPFQTPTIKEDNLPEEENFTELKTGGKRVLLDYDKNGFFVITVDNFKNKIIVKHYYKDNQPGFIIKGHSSESILLAILKKELISQMSHAGYLGSELSKAEIALKLNLKYTQDQTLRNK